MESKEFEKELKKALDAVDAVVKKYNPNNHYCAIFIRENRVSANNEYWDSDVEKGFDFSWRGGELFRALTIGDIKGEQSKEG